MYVSDISLTDFRSWPELTLHFDPGISTLVGRNGQGKTNIVEAIGYLATLSSHRASTANPLVRANQDRAVIRAKSVRAERVSLIDVEIAQGRPSRARINRTPTTRLRDILGIVHAVVFAPEDLALIKGDPEGRRRFLDDLLVQERPRFAAVRLDYERVLRQRGALLKTASQARRAAGPEALSTLDVWDSHLIELGAEIIEARCRLIDRLAPRLVVAYGAISAASGQALATYVSTADSAEAEPTPDDGAAVIDPSASREQIAQRLTAKLNRVRDKEIERGVNLVGPHRDDIVFGLGDLPAKGFASHGESWSLALALKLASADLLREADGDPILILDDVFAELDDARRARLADLVADVEQVLITAAVVDDVPRGLAGNRYIVDAGQVTLDVG